MVKSDWPVLDISASKSKESSNEKGIAEVDLTGGVYQPGRSLTLTSETKLRASSILQ